MSPESVEGYNKISTENTAETEKYLDVERGDVDQMYLQQQHAQNQPVQQNQQSQSHFDPVMFVKGMISSGFTPSPSQISAANANLSSDDTDSADHWFAIFLQRLMNQNKLKRRKNR